MTVALGFVIFLDGRNRDSASGSFHINGCIAIEEFLGVSEIIWVVDMEWCSAVGAFGGDGVAIGKLHHNTEIGDLARGGGGNSGGVSGKKLKAASKKANNDEWGEDGPKISAHGWLPP